ncbi:hypothetical protein ABT282_08780 [Streptomyces sp. NPDC000927]|uniref:hypothetical protein n=1 Tax=Streptomyces sp. NPDC000927 TaxID=3154371 RepID=UPI00332A34B2
MMSTISFNAVLVTASSSDPLPDMEEFRNSAPPWLRPLIIGPTWSEMGMSRDGDINGRVHYAFLSEGSKDGRDEAKEAQKWRDRFAELFVDIPYVDIVQVRYGGDHRWDGNDPDIKYLGPERDEE